MIIKRKNFTRFDDTDRLKQMRDSDILAEKKKTGPGFSQVAGTTASGAIAAGTAGAVIGGVTGLTRKGGNLNLASKAAKGLGTKGLVVGGVLAGAYALRKRSKAAKDNKFYNDRLEYAQKQAMRREKKDWKTNMTQRESYTY